MASQMDVTTSASQSEAVDLFLAVDTGGTKTCACFVDFSRPEESRIVGRGRSSAGNPFSVGFEEATRAIHSAIKQAREEAPQIEGRVGRLMLSIAGAANQKMAEKFVRWAHDNELAGQVAIISDVLPILAGGTPNCCGIALIAGTGSIAFGRATDGRTKRCGGWGYLLGDEGSGYSVGRSALWLTLRELESETPIQPGSLSDMVLKALDAKAIMDITKTVYTSDDPRSRIASLAPVVVAAAENGDRKAETTLDWAATELAELVARTADLIDGNGGPIPLAIGGGFLLSSGRLRDHLRDWLERFDVKCEMMLVDDPLMGCIRLADPACAPDLVQWHKA
jgi:N-acetylglucosamine kinase-like BadF-type ATPase